MTVTPFCANMMGLISISMIHIIHNNQSSCNFMNLRQTFVGTLNHLTKNDGHASCDTAIDYYQPCNIESSAESNQPDSEITENSSLKYAIAPLRFHSYKQQIKSELETVANLKNQVIKHNPNIRYAWDDILQQAAQHTKCIIPIDDMLQLSK